MTRKDLKGKGRAQESEQDEDEEMEEVKEEELDDETFKILTKMEVEIVGMKHFRGLSTCASFHILSYLYFDPIFNTNRLCSLSLLCSLSVKSGGKLELKRVK